MGTNLNATIHAHVIERSKLTNTGPVYMASLDLSAAFHCVIRQILWDKMFKLGFPLQLVAMISKMHTDTCYRVRITSDGALSDPIKTCVDVKQGCNLAATFFNT